MIEVISLAVENIQEPGWNPTEMDEAMRCHLQASLERFGVVVPLVVRRVGDGIYETVGGAQRLSILKDAGTESAPCVVVEVDDTEARILSQALNHIAGRDNPGMRAELLRELLEGKTQEDLLRLLPESAESLGALASLGEESIAQGLQAWQAAQQGARLRHFNTQLTQDQLQVVQRAVALFETQAEQLTSENPNRRGQSLYLLCEAYLDAHREAL